MSDKVRPPTASQRVYDLEAEDRMRERIAQRRSRLHDQLQAAFAELPKDSPERDRVDLVRGFLTFVADNIDSYATRTRVTNPLTGEVVEEPWVALCGATIRALDVPTRIQRLVLELVDGVIPEADLERRRTLATSAGFPFTAKASAADVKALEKKGMLAAFGGKLLVDSRHLISEQERSDAEAYFTAARRIAAELEESPYQTQRDRKFLAMVRSRYEGGLPGMVDAQREHALKEIAQRDADCPQLERVLRGMLERPFAPDRGRSIEDWYIAARIAFQSETYIYARLDEFRAALEARMAKLEGDPTVTLNPEAAQAAATGPVAAAIARLEAYLQSQGAPVARQSAQRLDAMQVVRENAGALAKPEVVAQVDAWLSDETLLEQFARYKVAAFRQVESDLRARLHQELVMWDELFRSAPLSDGQRERLDTYRETLLAPLRARDVELPEDLGDAKMLLPFGGRILPLLKKEAEFEAFEDWMQRVRAVYGDRPSSDDGLPVADPMSFAGPLEPTPLPWLSAFADPDAEEGAEDLKWYPTLIDVPRELDEQAVPRSDDLDDPEISGLRPRRAWMKRWFGA